MKNIKVFIHIVLFISCIGLFSFATCRTPSELAEEEMPSIPQEENNKRKNYATFDDSFDLLLTSYDGTQDRLGIEKNKQNRLISAIGKKDMEKREIEGLLKELNEPKKEEPKKEEPKKDTVKKADPKKQEPKKVDPKKADPKKTTKLKKTKKELDSINVVSDSLKKVLRDISIATADLEKKSAAIDSTIAKLKAFAPVKFSDFRKYIKSTTGAKDFYFHGVKYYAFIADLNTQTIRFHWKHPKKKKIFNRIRAVGEYLTIERKEIPLMITNAGMFSPNYQPQGLFISDSIESCPLDSGNFPEAGNFYLMPNGVFSVDLKGKARIDTTEEYQRLVKEKKYHPRFATQSGPMLVINGRIHPAFTKGSINRKIRSGAGIISENKVAFILSVDPVNFYDFAFMYKEVFGCENALFLDGAISEMYLKDVPNEDINGTFGPIISISTKMKPGPVTPQKPKQEPKPDPSKPAPKK